MTDPAYGGPDYGPPKRNTEIASPLVTPPLPTREQIIDRLRELRADLDDWIAGRRSTWNTYAEVGAEERVAALAACAQADAAETAKIASAIGAYIALLDTTERVELRVEESSDPVGSIVADVAYPGVDLHVDSPEVERPVAVPLALLYEADSICSLVAHRHSRSRGLPADVVRDLLKVSGEIRALTSVEERR